MKKSHQIGLVLVPILLGACGTEVPENLQRDVYTKYEDCMADWGTVELCQQVNPEDTQKFVSHTTGTSGGGSRVIYWGPAYHPSERAVMYNNNLVSPGSNKAMSKPFAVTSTSSTAARSSAGTPHFSGSRSGFGGTGRSVSVGGGRGGASGGG